MFATKNAITRLDLEEQFPEILKRGPLTEESIQELLTFGRVSDPNVILQSSSGTKPLLIPRSKDDILNAAERLFAPIRSALGEAPRRVALIGGVSHVNAASRLSNDNFRLGNFRLTDIDALNEFNPDFLSCYPSVLRDLMANPKVNLRGLRTINIGGEPVLRSDVLKARTRLEVDLIFEQYGSTEMPTMALKMFDRNVMVNTETSAGALLDIPYALEATRFTFAIPEKDGWHPIVVKDKYPNLLAPFGVPYMTGDEGLFKQNKLHAVKRTGERSFDFLSDVDHLMMKGCTNVQFSTTSCTLRYSGDISLDKTVVLNGMEFLTHKIAPKRRSISNKMPMLVSDDFMCL